jgi:hypothetical protein
MDGAPGSSQTSATLTTLATVVTQDSWMRRFCSAPIAAQTIDNAVVTITLAVAASESNAVSNFLVTGTLGVWRPSAGSLVGLIADDTVGNTPGFEPGTTETWGTSTTSGSGSVTSQNGDILVLEIWRGQGVGQSMSTAYTNVFFYDGTTEGSASNAASYIDFSTAIVMSAGAAARSLVVSPRSRRQLATR